MKSRIIVSGMVQGIGFRPFVAKMAEKYKISGTVCNSGGTVHIVVCAALPVAEKFAERIRENAPKGAFISNMEILEEKGKAGEEEETEIIGFSIISSEEKNREESVPILAPDFGICPACAEEMERKSDRRYRYPFISCTACGPRYSILKKIPYDRNTTSMDRYSMCPECKEEYTSMAGRRRHAQTISCHNCGPQLLFRKEKTFLEKEEALKKAIDILNALNVDLQVLSSARGTADSTLADYFSVDTGEKDMIFALIKIKHKSKILALLNENLGLEKKNSGLAFTIPIKSAMYSVLNQMGFELN